MTSPESYLEKAFREGHLQLIQKGKTERILYVASSHSERWGDPEEKVRAAFFAELIYHYGYKPSRIGVEVIVPRRTPADRADLVVYKDDEHTEPFIVIENKKDGVSDNEFNQAIEQACGNRASLGATYAGAVAGGTRKFLNFTATGAQERKRNIVADLPVNYGKPYDFQRGTDDTDEDLAARIQRLYDEEKKREPDVFTDKLNVEPSVLARVVEHLESLSLSRTDLDTKGVAFGESIGL